MERLTLFCLVHVAILADGGFKTGLCLLHNEEQQASTNSNGF